MYKQGINFIYAFPIAPICGRFVNISIDCGIHCVLENTKFIAMTNRRKVALNSHHSRPSPTSHVNLLFFPYIFFIEAKTFITLYTVSNSTRFGNIKNRVSKEEAEKKEMNANSAMLR